MQDTDGKSGTASASFTHAIGEQGGARQKKLLKAADELRIEMEHLASRVRDLIVEQPPVELLGYLSAQFSVGILADMRTKGDSYRPDKELIKKFQLALEYAHAVWATHANLKDDTTKLDEASAHELFLTLDKLSGATMMYCMASAAANPSGQTKDTEFHAKSSWTLIRGHRYQVLEQEFFEYILKPHDAALQSAYNMSATEIAEGIQGFADSMRTGFSTAAQAIYDRMNQTQTLSEGTGDDISTVINELKDSDSTFATDLLGAMKDLFSGGTRDLSRHSNFTAALLADISYEPGGNDVFFADGDFKGTPMRTLPARVRPGIKLGDSYYATDGQFIRDSFYRSIQRGLISRNPAYKIPWDQGQQLVTETAYPAIFREQLKTSVKWTGVFFRDVRTGQWVETDLVMTLCDVLFVVEAKAGVMAMHSPATNFDKHERTIRKLIVEAYEQCKRFIEYLASASEVILYNRSRDQYVEVGRLRRNDFRLVLPIGLTVEAFTPFSAMCKELKEIAPILGSYPFISMSVDDLFVLNRFLPTAGQLIHYLEVRQQAASITRVMIFDEIEHLGSYISDNRFDMTMRKQLKNADMLAWDSFGDVVDKFFERPDWNTATPPQQEFPPDLAMILAALDKCRPFGWLEMDGYIRDMEGKTRKDFSTYIAKIKPAPNEDVFRRMLFGGEVPIQLWLCGGQQRPSLNAMRQQAQIGCLAAGVRRVRVLRVSYKNNSIEGCECAKYSAPAIIQADYPMLSTEAERQRARFIQLDKKRRKKR